MNFTDFYKVMNEMRRNAAKAKAVNEDLEAKAKAKSSIMLTG